MGGGGNRPKNHIQAAYVTVTDRQRGYIQFYQLDARGDLVFAEGVPRLIREEPYNQPREQPPEVLQPEPEREPEPVPEPPAPELPARLTADPPPETAPTLDWMDDEATFEEEPFAYDFNGPEWL